ncbi:hypothetical protein RTM1035_01980 [Roseovarius sp. TM1035]|nr:hypothetical protein RTM1035_01980 [Roseovarius sp. TM1035]
MLSTRLKKAIYRATGGTEAGTCVFEARYHAFNRKQLIQLSCRSTLRPDGFALSPRHCAAWEHMLEAKEAIRGLIEKSVLHPDPTTGRMSVHLHVALAGILALSLGGAGKSGQQKTSLEQEVTQSIEFLVAGVGFEPTTFRL